MTSFQGWTPPGVARPLARRSGAWSGMLPAIISQVSGENYRASCRFEGQWRDVSGERVAADGSGVPHASAKVWSAKGLSQLMSPDT